MKRQRTIENGHKAVDLQRGAKVSNENIEKCIKRATTHLEQRVNQLWV